MKTIALCVCMILIMAAPATALEPMAASRKGASVDKRRAVEEENPVLHKIASDINADREKIIQEEKAIKAGAKDAAVGKAAIAALKKDIRNKNNQRGRLLYGRGEYAPQTRQKIK